MLQIGPHQICKNCLRTLFVGSKQFIRSKWTATTVRQSFNKRGIIIYQWNISSKGSTLAFSTCQPLCFCSHMPAIVFIHKNKKDQTRVSCLLWSIMLQESPSYKDVPTKGHPSYQARFEMHWDSKILLNYPLKRGPPSYKDVPTFHFWIFNNLFFVFGIGSHGVGWCPLLLCNGNSSYYYITPTAVGWCIAILRFFFTIIIIILI
jgi:hypothetical protein